MKRGTGIALFGAIYLVGWLIYLAAGKHDYQMLVQGTFMAFFAGIPLIVVGIALNLCGPSEGKSSTPRKIKPEKGRWA